VNDPLEPPDSKRKRFARTVALVFISVLAIGLAAASSAHETSRKEDGDIWFVHFTDPHLFLKPEDKDKQRHEALNKEALIEMLARINSLPRRPDFLVFTGDLGIDPCEIQPVPPTSTSPTASQTPTIDKNEKSSASECATKVDETKRKTQVEKVANILGESPVRDIYLVAGNNDIARESAGDQAIKYFNSFIDEVQDQLQTHKSNVTLHNLTRCYATGQNLSGCYADISDTSYRLVGFASYSFKNSKDEAGRDQTQTQADQMEKLQRLLDLAKRDKKKVLIITHTPAMYDPFALAQWRYAKRTHPVTRAPPSTSASSSEGVASDTEPPTTGSARAISQLNNASTWKVQEGVSEEWMKAIDSGSVLGVFAGHLHDAHKEIYRRPYTWADRSEYRAAFDKLFIAPALAVKNQDKSPIQARGFSLVRLKGDQIESQLFWYNSETGTFSRDVSPQQCHRYGFWRKVSHLFCGISPCGIVEPMWNLDRTDNSLVRMAVLLIAFLTAFLTIIAIWQIPPGVDPFAEPEKSTQDASKKPQTVSNSTSDSTPFSSRFGKTIIAGLGGLIAAQVVTTLGNEKPSADTKWYYIVWFIFFFFSLLLLLNFVRALVEALRARVAVIYYPPTRVRPAANEFATSKGGAAEEPSRWQRFLNWLGYWTISRPGHWLVSLRVPVIIFFDTFINLIQGKNQTQTRIFEDKIIEQQKNELRATRVLQNQLNKIIYRALVGKITELLESTSPKEKVEQAKGGLFQPFKKRYKDPSKGQLHENRASSDPDIPGPEDVRVNISVLSVDESNVFYVVRTPGSALPPFTENSVAWVSVVTGRILWYKRSYSQVTDIFKKIILFANVDGMIPPGKKPLLLSDYYQRRNREDYHAFIMLPFPWPRRGHTDMHVKGAIHISFRRERDFNRIFLPDEDTDPRNLDKLIEKVEPKGKEAKLDDDESKKAAALGTNLYKSGELMLQQWCRDDQVKAALNEGLAVLSELMQGFNEIIYKNYIERA